MIREVFTYDRHPGVKNLFLKGDIRDDIETAKWQIGRGNLITIAASTCIILAAHNEKTNQGLLGHFSSITEANREGQENKRSFRAAVDAIGSLGEPEATSVWLGGATPHLQGGSDSVEPDRVYAERTVRELAEDLRLDGRHISVAWSEAGRVVDVELDCVNGILVAHNYPEA